MLWLDALQLTDFRQMHETNTHVEDHPQKETLFQYMKRDAVGADHKLDRRTVAQIDGAMPIAAVFYQYVERFVDFHKDAEQFLRLDDDAELFAVLLSRCVPAVKEGGDRIDITVDDIFGSADSAGGGWSLLRFSINLNPAMRDQLSTAISALQSDTEMRRRQDGMAATKAHSLLYKRDFVRVAASPQTGMGHGGSDFNHAGGSSAAVGEYKDGQRKSASSRRSTSSRQDPGGADNGAGAEDELRPPLQLAVVDY